MNWCREGRIRFSVGYDLSAPVKAAILGLPEADWEPAEDTDQGEADVAAIERRHRARARVEDHIRSDKDTGLSNVPFRNFEHNRVWLALVLIAHDLITWTQLLVLGGELARAEPKRLRYRLLHVAARLAFHGRRAKLRLQATWPWAHDLAAAFAKLISIHR